MDENIPAEEVVIPEVEETEEAPEAATEQVA